MRQGSPFTARVVFITADDTAPQGIVAALPGGATTYRPGVEIYTSGGGAANVAINPPGTHADMTLPPAGTVTHWVARYDGSTISLQLASGQTDITAALGGGPTYNADQLLIGFLPGLNWALNGWFGEFALWPGLATTAEADALLEGAAAWWGN